MFQKILWSIFVFLIVCARVAGTSHAQAQYDFLKLPAVADALRDFEKEFADPQSDVHRYQLRERLAEKLRAQKAFMARVGYVARVAGPALYYPFGGFDPFYPFALSNEISDVYAMGADSAGTLHDYIAWMKEVAPYIRSASSLRAYDSSFYSIEMQQAARVTSLAPLVISRIYAHLDGRLIGLYFFRIMPTGDFQYIPASARDMDREFHNVMFLFEDARTKKRRRYWYMKFRVGDEASNFPHFIKQARFQTLLIKGAPDMWDPIRDRGIRFRKLAIRYGLEPARRNNARVVTDHRMRPLGRQERTDPHPIWKFGYVPTPMKVVTTTGFGYSQYNENLYYGDGKMLLGDSCRNLLSLLRRR